MSGPLELDYIGLAESSSVARNSDQISSSSSSSSSSVTVNKEDRNGSNFNLEETELRLGLPGSEFSERKIAAPGVSPIGYPPPPPPPGSLRNLVSGAKRGFSDAINGSSREWVFPLSSVSEVDLGKATTKETASASQSSNPSLEKKPSVTANTTIPAAKTQVVGWPPVRSFRKNTLASNLSKNSDDGKEKLRLDCSYVKVSMEGAPYLRKIDLKTYNNYMQLSLALENMFSCFTIGRCHSGNKSHLVNSVEGSEYVLTYEDKDGDWMLVGDVPWEMFVNSCQKLRIVKGSEGIGLVGLQLQGRLKNSRTATNS